MCPKREGMSDPSQEGTTVRLFDFAATTTLLLAAASILPAQSVQQNIDAACVQVLGSACSQNSVLYGTFSTITSQISNRQLNSDQGSIQNYLMAMVKSSTGWQNNLVDWAWAAAKCQNQVMESQWVAKFGTGSGQWQTYQQLVNLLLQQSGACTLAAVKPAAAAPATQYVGASAMQQAYQTVWGAAASYATVQTNCTTTAESCAQSLLASYVSSHGTAILSTIVPPVFTKVLGFSPSSTYVSQIAATYHTYWLGADDLANYLTQTKTSWPNTALAVIPSSALGTTTTVYLRVDSAGDIINGANQVIPGTAGSYFLSASGGKLVAAGGGNYNASINGTAITVTSGASGVLVNNRGIPYKLVAAGGGNFQLYNGGALVAAGGGNLVAAGGGNLVAAGGGNLQAVLPSMAAQYLLGPSGGTFLATDGASLNQTVLASVISHNGSALVSNQVTIATAATQSPTYSLQSVGGAAYRPVSVTAPTTTWSIGTAYRITWTGSGSPASGETMSLWLSTAKGMVKLAAGIAPSQGYYNAGVTAGSLPSGTTGALILRDDKTGSQANGPTITVR